mmetsp:Transcript_154822/g.288646  ORF Transcript_154822/g.288646 Transcript_154822/m.288646 type:complete len:491 (-) Transcript_154822:58-1530(-)
MSSQRGSYTALRDSGYRESPTAVEHENPDEKPCLEFIEGDRFQMTIGVVIFLNILVLWGETDAESWVIWPFCDNIFLLIFIAEIVLRIMHFGMAEYFTGDDRWWAYLDTTVVMLGIMDLWITPFFVHKATSQKSGATGHQFSVLRFLRLMRLLRLLRVFKMFSDLRRFASALVAMGKEFRWIFAVLSLFIFCTAITLTHLLGHGEALGSYHHLTEEHAEEFELIQRHWGDVGKSLFTLFQLTTIDNWDMLAMPICSIAPRWRIFFAFFIMFASWIMISVLTAVASNSMIEATSDRKEKEQEELEHKHLMFIEFLREVFHDADVDGNEVLDRDEFSALMEKDFVHKKMRALGIHFTEDELFKAWDMLDIDESGEITIDEFVTGLSYLQEGLATKHIVNVEYSMKRVNARLDQRLQRVREEMSELMDQVKTINNKLVEQTDAQHQQQLSFWLWQQWAAKNENIDAGPKPAGKKLMRAFSSKSSSAEIPKDSL